jgi:hypothetical protein
MKKKLAIFLGMLFLLLSMPSKVSAGSQIDHLFWAQQAGQIFVNQTASTNSYLSLWEGATLDSALICYDLKGNVNAYMFAILKGKEYIGHVLVGNKDYCYDIFEAGESSPPKVPLNTVKLLYLGIDGLYALYKVNGELVGENLVYKDTIRFSAMKYWLPSPDEYQASKALGESSKSDYLLSSGSTLSQFHFLTMYWYQSGSRVYCGPCSGVSIGQYYKNNSQTGHYYPNLYSSDAMYDSLYRNMQAAPWVIPYNYGPGFVYMTNECYYNNFRGDWYPFVGGSHYFGRIVPDIDAGWPHALCCYPQNAHWRAIRGYNYISGTHNIICTNSATHDNNETLNWDILPSSQHDTVRIRDNG